MCANLGAEMGCRLVQRRPAVHLAERASNGRTIRQFATEFLLRSTLICDVQADDHVAAYLAPRTQHGSRNDIQEMRRPAQCGINSGVAQGVAGSVRGL